ncbi:DUF6615 family protein [Nocardia nova]|uniref:DUF6615 family protein n=1 Tax=Nocardia nova TaxID=37330 RepID=UPI0011AFFBF7|nr:DUF6615 family protein [Nocardia nova]
MNTLRAFMDELAAQTWWKYRDGHSLGLAPAEESVTDSNLLELHRRFPQLAVRRLTKSAEKRVGADWEWWVGSASDGWLCLRIQAKRINDSGYPMLDHPGFEDDDRQYEALIRSCQDTHFFPYHVFYNGWERTRFRASDGALDDRTVLENNPSWPHTEPPPFLIADVDPHRLPEVRMVRPDGRELVWWGCAAMSTYRVAELHSVTKQRNYAPRYLARAMPWSRLFATRPNEGLPGVDPFVFVEAGLLNRIHYLLLSDTVAAGGAVRDIDKVSVAPDGIEELQGRRISQLPDYARAILRGRAAPQRFDEAFFEAELAPATYTIVTDLTRFFEGRGVDRQW